MDQQSTQPARRHTAKGRRLPAALAAALLAASPWLALAGTATQAPLAAPEANSAEAAFAKADTDKDGRLSKAEAARLPAVAERFDELDKNKDGLLSLEEFLAAFAPAK
jgi:hypothetical protein